MSDTTTELKLIIFDCDGTLVDSEYLNNKVSSQLLCDIGLTQYTPEKFMAEFTGFTWTNIKNTIEERHQITLPKDIIERYIDQVNKALEGGTPPIDGVHDLVRGAGQRYKICVASNGQRSNVMKSLSLNGFDEFFSEENIFTRIQVPNGKPAPDLFLFAAAQMGVSPAHCLVIEDSPTGVQAGVAADMTVWGFTGTAHEAQKQEKRLRAAGAEAVFGSLIHISEKLGV